MTWQPELNELRRRQQLADQMGGPDKVSRQHEVGRADKQIYAKQLAGQLRLPLVRLVEGTGGGGSVKMLEQMGHIYVPVNPGWDHVVDNLSIVPMVAAGLGPVAGLGAARQAVLRHQALSG